MSETPPPTTDATAAEPGRERTFTDADGVRWRVAERAFGQYDRRRGLSLIFSSDSAVRRVRDYPANWIDLPDEALAALSWNP